MEPSTGEILAMVNVDVDPESGEPRLSTNNMAVTTVFEPGSVMKIVGMSGVVEDQLLSTANCVNAPDQLTIGGASFTEYSPHGGGCWPLEDVIVNSSNTGSINIALTLGEQRMYDYFKAFGLGEPTNLGFPNELAGFVRPVEDWWGSSIGGMPIGQGISVTPLQMLLAYNTIANDGTFTPAQLVRATIDGDGVEHLLPKGDEHQVISPETAQTVRAMLTEVVTRGTARSAQVDGYYPGGKTGTAQIPAPDGGYVFPDGTKHYMATFAGMIPADDPKLSMIIVTQQPTAGAYTGGAVSGPVFSELAEFAVKHMRIAPSDLELAPEDLGPIRVDPNDETEEPYLLGEPPDGRVRATPATAGGDEDTEIGAG
jgi:cell division protein FtsI (penicillin-binding protein 3)